MATSKPIPPKKAPVVETVQRYFRLNSAVAYNCTYERDLSMSDRLIGIEVEVENHELKQHPTHAWMSKNDGSLRNNGVEWVTHPISAQFSRGALQNLMEDCLSNNCCFSPRTSVHVHINCLDMETNKIHNLVVLYSMFEPLLYKFTGRSRNKNIFCVPVLETSLLSGSKDKSFDSLTQGWSKYTGFNILPLRELGTVEARHMYGTRNVDKLVIWIDILTRMVDYVATQPKEELQEMLKSFGSDYNIPKILVDVFGPNAIHLGYEDYSDIRSSVQNAKQAYVPVLAVQDALAPLISGDSPYFTNRMVKGL